MLEEVILVDELDQAIGVADKQQAHLDGSLHRAFSIFVFNSAGQLLLQKRAAGKYHSSGLWSNSCCGHPRPGEALEQAIHRRLKEEMGFDCKLVKAFDFIYRAELENSLTEHEFDHVIIGRFDGDPQLNSDEADDYKWADLAELKISLANDPGRYTFWLKHVFDAVLSHLSSQPLTPPTLPERLGDAA